MKKSQKKSLGKRKINGPKRSEFQIIIKSFMRFSKNVTKYEFILIYWINFLSLKAYQYVQFFTQVLPAIEYQHK